MEELKVPATQGLRSGQGACTPERIMTGVIEKASNEMMPSNGWAFAMVSALSEAGFAIVPKEPTNEMIDVAYPLASNSSWEGCKQIYRLMIAASGTSADQREATTKP